VSVGRPVTGAAEGMAALRAIRGALAAAEEDPAWPPAPR
jgi:orotidine-5'-phosphate decarboxylase